jgi:hypothetical protein
VEIDSNRVENLIRPIALNRKNALCTDLKATMTAIADSPAQSRLDEAAAMEIQAFKLRRQWWPASALMSFFKVFFHATWNAVAFNVIWAPKGGHEV